MTGFLQRPKHGSGTLLAYNPIRRRNNALGLPCYRHPYYLLKCIKLLWV